jgi:hypothetical protein
MSNLFFLLLISSHGISKEKNDFEDFHSADTKATRDCPLVGTCLAIIIVVCFVYYCRIKETVEPQISFKGGY